MVVPEAEVRPRGEAHTGRDRDLDEGNDALISQRTRIGVGFDAGRVGARVLVQDVRVWGTETDTLDFNAEGLDFHVGTLSIATDDVSLTLGRQEIPIHEHRLIGNVDWLQQARSFDAARFSWKVGEANGDLVGGLLREGDAFLEAEDGDLVIARAGWFREPAQVDLLGIWDHQGAADLDRGTFGVYAKGATGVLSGRLEAYGQVGQSGDADIRAAMVGVRGTVAPGSNEITLWYDFLSGDEAPSSGPVTAFSTLYATNHKFYGLIDIVAFQVGGPADGSGLHDLALKLATKPEGLPEAHLDLHAFASAAPSETIGFEPDLWLVWPLGPALTMSGGGSVFVPSGDGDPDLWCWLQLEAKLPR
jgi:hypothetical protein